MYTRLTRHAQRLPLVQLADGVFDVLAQQTPLFGRHMPVAAALIEIWRNRGAQHHVRSRVIGAGVVAIDPASTGVGCMLVRESVGGRLGNGERRAQ